MGEVSHTARPIQRIPLLPETRQTSTCLIFRDAELPEGHGRVCASGGFDKQEVARPKRRERTVLYCNVVIIAVYVALWQRRYLACGTDMRSSDI